MHTAVLLQGKCKSINVYRRAIYRRARRGGKLILKKKLPFLGHLSPKVYIHYVCFPSFLFPGDLHDSLDILWQPLATCHQGEAMYIGGLWEGISPKKTKKRFFLGHLSPEGKPYIYIYTLCLFFLLPFPWESSWLSGHSLATPEEVWQSVWISSNTITGIWT